MLWLNKTRDAANESAPTLTRRGVFSLPTLLLFAILAAFAYFLATSFDMDWRATFDNIRHINPWLYALGFAAYYLSFSVRGQRWRMLARNTGELDGLAQSRLLSMASSAAYIIIGWFVNSVTRLRLGDGYRVWLFARHSGGSFSWSLGVVVAERALEIAVMGILLLSMGRQDAVLVALVDRSITFVSVIAIGVVIFLAVQIWQGGRARGKLGLLRR